MVIIVIGPKGNTRAFDQTRACRSTVANICRYVPTSFIDWSSVWLYVGYQRNLRIVKIFKCSDSKSDSAVVYICRCRGWPCWAVFVVLKLWKVRVEYLYSVDCDYQDVLVMLVKYSVPSRSISLITFKARNLVLVKYAIREWL